MHEKQLHHRGVAIHSSMMQGRLPAAIAHARMKNTAIGQLRCLQSFQRTESAQRCCPEDTSALVRVAGKRVNSLPMVVHNVPLLIDGCASVEHGLQAVHHGARSIGAYDRGRAWTASRSPLAAAS